MTIKGRVWLVGLCLGTAVAIGLAGESSTRPYAPIVGLMMVCLAGLIGELAGLFGLPTDPPGIPDSHASIPADGVAEILALPGLDGVANRSDGRWRRSRAAESVQVPPTVRSIGSRQSAPALLGRVAIFSIFLGADGRSWTDEEIARGHAALERAGAWLEREAIRWLAPLQIELAEVYFQADDPSDDPIEVRFVGEGGDYAPFEPNAGVKYLTMVSRAALKLGFGDVVDLQARVGGLVDANRQVWLLHLRRAGRSIAIPASTSDLEGVGLAVCFARESSFPERLAGPGRVDPTTVAHELLHLFGASDKYGPPLESFATGAVSSAEIMRLDDVRLGRMKIDRLTALEIGWDVRADPSASKEATRRRSFRPPAG